MWSVVVLTLGAWACWRFRKRKPVLHVAGVGLLAFVLVASAAGWLPGTLLNRCASFACALYLSGNVLLFRQLRSELSQLNLQQKKAWEALQEALSGTQSAAVKMTGGSRKAEVRIADTNPFEDVRTGLASVQKVTYEAAVVGLVCLAVPVIMMGIILTRIP